MITKLRITVLAENCTGQRHLLAEHGWALWIEADDRKILFDTGQGLALAHNAERLGVGLESTDAVVLSHGHYDHVGGLAAELSRFAGANLYAHPAAFRLRFSRRGPSGAQSASPPIHDADQLRHQVARLILSLTPTAVTDGVWVTGEIPRRHAFEEPDGGFYLNEARTQPDPLLDDQALYIESRRGLVVVLGCAHAGVVNTLDYVLELTGRDRIHAVLGGMHLLHANEARIIETVAALRRYDVQVVAPAHCTGGPATRKIWAELPDRCVECRVGSRFVFE
ncbi:MAG: MBL fold metallo-hydrolase [Phycisphaerae bacterium]|nr:MBL fold metallo-hydrolase [Phycisphaerae bacterium]